MTRFIQTSACRGLRPTDVGAAHLLPRPHLVSRLMANREALRVITAPEGFGKKSLAVSYAELAFEFAHVFWIRGESPCLLREIDNGEVASAVLKCDKKAALVVIADVPALSEERAARLEGEIRALLAAGCEVVATVSPTRDTLTARFPDAVVVDGGALMVGEREDDEDRAHGGGRGRPLTLDRRIPCLRWAERGAENLAQGLAHEDLPPVLALASWAMLCIGKGSLADLGALEPSDADASFLASSFPYLGIDEAEGTFAAATVPLEVARRFLAGRLGELAGAAGLASADEAAALMARCALKGGTSRRAARLMEALASRRAVSQWLMREGWQLLAARAAGEVLALYEIITRTRIAERPRLNAMMAWAWAQQGARAQAIDYARRALGAADGPAEVRLAAALAAHDQGNAAVREEMENELALWMAAEEPLVVAARDVAPVLRTVVACVLCRRLGTLALDQWDRYAPTSLSFGDASPLEIELMLYGAALALEDLEARGLLAQEGADAALLCQAPLVRLVALCQRALGELLARKLPLGFGALRAASALERADGPLTVAGLGPLSTPVAVALAEAWADEGAHRAEPRKLRRPSGAPAGHASRSNRAIDEATAHLAALPHPAVPEAAGTPLLRLRLFGTLEVRRGDADLSRAFHNRKKVRLLLALLVLHRGQELTRDRLVQMLWPATNPRTGSKNFYRLWQDLWNILAIGDRCPYLIRDQYGCRLDAALFTSDVEHLERLTRHLLFGAPGDAVAWEQTLYDIQESFSAPLLPSELRNEVVARYRDRYASSLVDGLIAASARLLSQGESRGALWFAREARARDGRREDVLACLMRAQMAADQRTAALETYFLCRDFLAESLGLDPSPEMAELYQQLIDGRPLAAHGR